MREWRWWHGYGVRSKYDEYDPERDWRVVDKALNAPTLLPLGFMGPKDFPRRGKAMGVVVDGVPAPSNIERKGAYITRWVWKPNSQRHVRLLWSAVDRSVKRLYEHGLVWSYAHTKGGHLRVTPFEQRKRHVLPEKRPIFGREYNYGNSTWLHCPHTDAAQERAEDKRLQERPVTWPDKRKMMGYVNAPEQHESHLPSYHECIPMQLITDLQERNWLKGKGDDFALAKSEAALIVAARNIESTRIKVAEMSRHESNNGACSTWTSKGRFARYHKVKCVFTPRAIKIAEYEKERGYCWWPRRGR